MPFYEWVTCCLLVREGQISDTVKQGDCTVIKEL